MTASDSNRSRTSLVLTTVLGLGPCFLHIPKDKFNKLKNIKDKKKLKVVPVIKVDSYVMCFKSFNGNRKEIIKELINKC